MSFEGLLAIKLFTMLCILLTIPVLLAVFVLEPEVEDVNVKSWTGEELIGMGGGGDPTETVFGENSASAKTRQALMISLISLNETD